MPEIPAAEPSDALLEQLKTDAGPHATPDQLRAAEKRRAALGTRTAEPEQRRARETETTSTKKAKR